jgi:hypothetical protein
MNKIILTLLLGFSSFANAQIDIGTPGNGSSLEDQMKLNIARKNVEYSGAIVGYAKSCNFPEFEYKLIENKLFKNLQVVGINNVQMSTLKNLFKENVEMAQTRGKNNTKIECELFSKEFKKIISAINSPAQ